MSFISTLKTYPCARWSLLTAGSQVPKTTENEEVSAEMLQRRERTRARIIRKVKSMVFYRRWSCFVRRCTHIPVEQFSFRRLIHLVFLRRTQNPRKKPALQECVQREKKSLLKPCIYHPYNNCTWKLIHHLGFGKFFDWLESKNAYLCGQGEWVRRCANYCRLIAAASGRDSRNQLKRIW